MISYNYTPAPDPGSCDTCSSFYDYARMSELMKLYGTHKGVIVLQEQQGLPDSTAYIPMDLTVGLIPATITDIRDDSIDLDIPGKVHGRGLDFDNSLTRVGDGTNYRSAPITSTLVCPAHAVTVASDSTFYMTGIRNSDRGDACTIEFVLLPDVSGVSLIENLSNLVSIPGTFRYTINGGVIWNNLTKVRRWDGATVMTATSNIAAAVDMHIGLESTFGATATTGDYTLIVSVYKENDRGETVKIASATDTFTLS